MNASKEERLTQLRKQLHDEEIAVFYSEAYGNSEEDKAHNRKLEEGLRAIHKQITDLENS